jgi:uncharacterized protein (TIGR02217 family)
MSFHEVQFPTSISRDAAGGPTWNTTVIQTDSGAEQRISRWDAPRRRYDAAYGVRTAAAIYAVLQFFLARQGRLYGFRWKDWQDFTTASDGISSPANDDQAIGTGNGTTTVFQLKKTYTSGAGTHTRTITKPVADTTVVAVAGVAQTAGTDFTVDTTTGQITFDSAPASGAAITAGCQFDVPVRFDDDHLDTTLRTAAMHAIPSIPLVEILDETELDVGVYTGGAQRIATEDSSTALDFSNGWHVSVAYDTAGTILTLPDPSSYPAGFRATLYGESGSYDVQYSGTSYGTLTAGFSLDCVVGEDSGGNKVWRVS